MSSGKSNDRVNSETLYKQLTLIQCWYNVGQASQTLKEHHSSIGAISGACCEFTAHVCDLILQVNNNTHHNIGPEFGPRIDH